MKREILWNEKDAAKATGGISTARFAATGISIDSRSVTKGDLFVALRGPNHDGHDFVSDAFRGGAVAALVDSQSYGISNDNSLLVVDDSLAGLEALAKAARQRSDARVVAVTGSVGKTGTKHALQSALSEVAMTHASPKSYNNKWGVSLSLARMPRNTCYGVFEVGMNRPGEITPLSHILQPHLAIITNVEAAHLEFFKNLDAIADAKAEVFDGLEGLGTAILNRDNAQYENLATAARKKGVYQVVDFGQDPKSWARIKDYALHSNYSSVSANVDGEDVTYRVGIAGRHWVYNSVAVLAAVKVVGADLHSAMDSLSGLSALKGRGNHHLVNTSAGVFEVIDDSYNANPASMRAAFETLGESQPGAGGLRIAVLGDMRELGLDSRKLHRDLVPALTSVGIDLVFCAGSHMLDLYDALPVNLRGHHAASAEKLLPAVLEGIRPGDVAMIKGSLVMQMGAIVEALINLDEPARALNGN